MSAKDAILSAFFSKPMMAVYAILAAMTFLVHSCSGSKTANKSEVSCKSDKDCPSGWTCSPKRPRKCQDTRFFCGDVSPQIQGKQELVYWKPANGSRHVFMNGRGPIEASKSTGLWSADQGVCGACVSLPSDERQAEDMLSRCTCLNHYLDDNDRANTMMSCKRVGGEACCSWDQTREETLASLTTAAKPPVCIPGESLVDVTPTNQLGKFPARKKPEDLAAKAKVAEKKKKAAKVAVAEKDRRRKEPPKQAEEETPPPPPPPPFPPPTPDMKDMGGPKVDDYD